MSGGLWSGGLNSGDSGSGTALQNPQEGHEAAGRGVCQGPAICLRRAVVGTGFSRITGSLAAFMGLAGAGIGFEPLSGSGSRGNLATGWPGCQVLPGAPACCCSWLTGIKATSSWAAESAASGVMDSPMTAGRVLTPVA